MGEQKPNRARAGWDAALRLGERVLDALFTSGTGSFARWVKGVWLAGLLLFGIYLWGVFYSWGNISLDFLDWAEVTGPRYALLQDALTKGQLPLHAANLTALRGVTDRYFAIPDTPFSPEIIALRYLEIGQYLFFDTVLLYLAGFIGLLLLGRKYRLSPLAFLLLFLLFNFNGLITGHLAVGHSIFTAYFLLPFFVLLVLDLLEREQVGWKWVLGFAVLQLVVLLQGLFHLYVWCLMFLGLLVLFNPRLLRPVATAGFFSVLVGLPRLLPPALIVGSITHEFMGGPATVTDLFASLVVLLDPDRAMVLPSKIFPLRWWEQDYYHRDVGAGISAGVWGAGAAVARPHAQIRAGAAAGGLPDINSLIDRAGVWDNYPRGAHSAIYWGAGFGALLCRAVGGAAGAGGDFSAARAGPAQAKTLGAADHFGTERAAFPRPEPAPAGLAHPLPGRPGLPVPQGAV